MSLHESLSHAHLLEARGTAKTGSDVSAMLFAGKFRPPDTGLSKAQVARLIAEENTRRLIRLGNGMIK